jgi:folate-binding protein YgfZ
MSGTDAIDASASPPPHFGELQARQTSASEVENEALRMGCGLLDRSQRGKLALTGSGAAEFLNGQVTNDVEKLQVAEGCYAAFLTHKGKMLGDLRILRTEDELLLDTERVALQRLFDMIRHFKIGYQVELHKRTLECGLLSLIGPGAGEVASAAGADALPPAVEHAHCLTSLAKQAVRLISAERPDGIDVLCACDGLEAVKAALIAAGARPVGDLAAETLRVELGVPRYGVDLDDTVIPQEAGLNERAVSFTKGCYVGQETVARLYYRGKPNRLLRGLLLEGPTDAGEHVNAGERVVGRIGSVALSPSLGPIALALLRREAAPGETVEVGERMLKAKVASLPFEPARYRAASNDEIAHDLRRDCLRPQ